MLPIIFAFAGPRLTADERALFKGCDPAGFILFRRNCASPEQLRALTDSLRELSGRADVPILIDQEGGRVARLGPPIWPAFPSGAPTASSTARGTAGCPRSSPTTPGSTQGT